MYAQECASVRGRQYANRKNESANERAKKKSEITKQNAEQKNEAKERKSETARWPQSNVISISDAAFQTIYVPVSRISQCYNDFGLRS